MFRERNASISNDARADLKQILAWYATQDTPGLDDRFYDDFLATLDEIGERATTFPIVWKTVRRAQLSVFPYGIYFEVEDQTIHILGVLHLHRHPKAWKGRA